MKKKMLSMFALCLVFVLVLSLGGCGTNQKTQSGNTPAQASGAAGDDSTAGEVVKIPMLLTNAGNDANTQVKEFLVEKFNEAYAGQYEAVVEWLPGVAEDLRAKLKMLNASNDLPAVVTELQAEPALVDLLVNNNRLADLKPTFDASEEWKKVAIPESVQFNTADGKMYTAPYSTADYVGVYYNKDHFAAAGIEAFPATWEDFWSACEKLKTAGYKPISLHTTETGWCPMLLGTASLSLNDDGVAFLNEMYPTDFAIPAAIEMLENVKKMFDYTTSDAVGGNYALAANNFASGVTSMIPNGPWMIPSLSDPQFAPEGFENSVGYATYPDNTMISDQGRRYGDAVSVDHPEEVQKGAMEFIKFKYSNEEYIRFDSLQTGLLSSVITLTEEEKAGLSPVMQEYAEIVSGVENVIPNYQGRWDPLTQNEIIPVDLVSYVNGDITVEEFAEKLSAAARQYAKDNQAEESAA